MKYLLLFLFIPAIAFVSHAQPNGWTSLVGYGKLANIIGGKGATPVVTATTAAELLTYAKSLTPMIILVSGVIEGPYDDVAKKYFQINIASNKTIIGQQGNIIKGIAFFAKTGTRNIILRNLNLQFNADPLKVQSNADLLGIEGSATNIWVDHCDFSNPSYVAGGVLTADGYIDIKGQIGDSLTLSYNHFHPHGRSVQFGSSTNVDIAERKGTIHHNYFESITGRPLVTFRGGNGHIFNNYFYNDPASPASTAVSSRHAACLKVENNVFENSGTSVSTEAALEAVGGFDVSGNIFVGSTEVVSTCTFAYPEGYMATIPAGLIEAGTAVKASVLANAGVNKLPAAILAGGEQEPTGVEEEKILNATLYHPNPFTEALIISSQEMIRYEVIDFTGNILENGHGQGNITVGQSLANGIYIVKMYKGNTFKAVKVSKK